MHERVCYRELADLQHTDTHLKCSSCHLTLDESPILFMMIIIQC